MRTLIILVFLACFGVFIVVERFLPKIEDFVIFFATMIVCFISQMCIVSFFKNKGNQEILGGIGLTGFCFAFSSIYIMFLLLIFIAKQG